MSPPAETGHQSVREDERRSWMSANLRGLREQQRVLSGRGHLPDPDGSSLCHQHLTYRTGPSPKASIIPWSLSLKPFAGHPVHPPPHTLSLLSPTPSSFPNPAPFSVPTEAKAIACGASSRCANKTPLCTQEALHILFPFLGLPSLLSHLEHLLRRNSKLLSMVLDHALLPGPRPRAL